MRHPVFANRGIVGAYWLVGLVLIILDYFVLRYGFKTSIINAAINASVYNLVILLLALPLWYPIFYLDKSKGIVYNSIQFIVTGGIYIGIWYLISHSLISSVEYYSELDLTVGSGYVLVRILTGCFIFLSFLSVYFVLIYADNLQEQKQHQSKLKGLLKEAELNALKSQLNPHFLFNSLNSISSLTITEPQGARKMITELSDFLRYSLKNNQELLMLSEELDNSLRYIEIEKVRFGDKIIFELDVDEECKLKKLPSLILQPLLENAIKYGVYDSLEPVLIAVKAEMKSGDLVISVENEYEQDALVNKGEGIGLSNIKKRMYSIYNKSDLVELTQTKKVFKVVLTCPQLVSYES
ncbi:sensor histidine kinase [Labilibacter marinus]|uniref:sensor histidine kinase n=1 Tax=Labilibacter marinus TaxID=1477105 RepID=UPI000837929C|nr:histidine kinase [Labilibacter marinus]